MTRLKEKYTKEIIAALQKQFQIDNKMAVPSVRKVVVNVGVGEAIQNPKLLDSVSQELASITGQKPVIRKARKAIAGFKLREGMPIGLMVTLRGDRMYEFLDRLFNIGLPRVRDFRGLSDRSFDGRGNYTLGIRDQMIFPEIDLSRSERSYGMNVTIVTDARNDEQARFLLAELGMPFLRREQGQKAAV